VFDVDRGWMNDGGGEERQKVSETCSGDATRDTFVLLKLPKELEFLLLAYRTIIYTIRQASGIRLLNNILPYSDMKLLLHVASQ
jgi:hypothetical protein